jgi:hypothetical protein
MSLRLFSGIGILACTVTGCSRYRPAVEVIETGNQPPASAIEFADPNRAFQLLEGFHAIERRAWRWTACRFALVLQPPSASSPAGAILELDFTVPEALLARHGTVTLSAAADALPLPARACDRPGRQRYRVEVPARALAAGPLKIEFALDRCLAAGEIDARELGVIVTTVALRPAGSGTPRKSDVPGGRSPS